MAAMLKLATPTSDPSREPLRVAIAKKTAADAALAAHMANVDDLRARTWAADQTAEAAKAQVEAIHTATVQHLADPTLPPPAMTSREARRRLEDADDDLATLEAARDAAKAATSGVESSAKFAVMDVNQAIASTIAGSANVRELVAEYRRRLRALVDLRGALYFLDKKGAIPADLKGWGGEEKSSDLTAEATWRAAFDALARAADARLPE